MNSLLEKKLKMLHIYKKIGQKKKMIRKIYLNLNLDELLSMLLNVIA